MSGACAELRCFCLVSVSRPGLAFRVCCECPDCVFAAARIASLVHLNFVSVETDARHNPRNSCRSRLYIEFVPQPFRLKHIGSFAQLAQGVANLLHNLSSEDQSLHCVALAVERRLWWHCSSQSG